MDFWRKILEKVRSWPEGLRRFVAGVSILGVTLLMLNGWGSLMASRVNKDFAPSELAQQKIDQSQQRDNSPEKETMTPLAGIQETFKGLQDLIARQISIPSLRELSPQRIFWSAKNTLSRWVQLLTRKVRSLPQTVQNSLPKTSDSSIPQP